MGRDVSDILCSAWCMLKNFSLCSRNHPRNTLLHGIICVLGYPVNIRILCCCPRQLDDHNDIAKMAAAPPAVLVCPYTSSAAGSPAAAALALRLPYSRNCISRHRPLCGTSAVGGTLGIRCIIAATCGQRHRFRHQRQPAQRAACTQTPAIDTAFDEHHTSWYTTATGWQTSAALPHGRIGASCRCITCSTAPYLLCARLYRHSLQVPCPQTKRSQQLLSATVSRHTGHSPGFQAAASASPSGAARSRSAVGTQPAEHTMSP